MGRRAFWLSGTLLATALMVFAFTQRAQPINTFEDAEARRIVEKCAIGTSEATRAGLSTGLAHGLRQVDAGAIITTSRVGAIVDKIGPGVVGAEIFKIYVACLNQQFELSLKARGVQIEPEPLAPPLAPGPGATGQANLTPSVRQTDRARADALSFQAPIRTSGPCSPIIGGSAIGTFNAECEGQSQ